MATKNTKKTNGLKRWFIKFFTGVDIDQLKHYETVAMAEFDMDSGMNDKYLFDFKNYASDYRNAGGTGFINGSIVTGGEVGNESFDTTPKKVVVKPVDVLNELETVPTPFSLALLDDKISILKEKSKLIVQHYAKREVNALIERLENRKKYVDNKEFFDKFQNTTDEKIDKLLGKYKLVMKSSDIFVPEFPDDAINIMKEYTEKMDLICGKKPIFYVIAEEANFKKAYEKRDPILLVQSPFGFYYQILGAWDKEMLLLSEL